MESCTTGNSGRRNGVPETIALLGNLNERAADDCAVVVDNSYSFRRLIYDDDKQLPVVVIGGNTLSRGLTLGVPYPASS